MITVFNDDYAKELNFEIPFFPPREPPNDISDKETNAIKHFFCKEILHCSLYSGPDKQGRSLVRKSSTE